MTVAFSSNLTNYGLGLYVHVPFCPNRCAYCAFYGEPPRRLNIDNYLQCIELEWRLRSCGSCPETIYFGGGTPGVLSCSDFEKIHRSLAIENLPKLREWTVEFSPATVRREKLRLLHDLGVTRISLGVQSFDDGTLAALGRRQTAKKSLEAYDLIREFDFSVNLDLIFAAPGQTLSQWVDDLASAVELGPDHLSTYCLTVEDGAPLWKNTKPVAAISRDYEFYAETWNFLGEKGYDHYEVSNFCRPGCRCLHNCNSWAMGQWLGLGPSAASQFGRRRFRNVANLNGWICGMRAGKPLEEDVVTVTDQLLLQDSIIFGLRTADGISTELLAAAERFRWDGLGELFKDFHSNGFIEIGDGRIRPTDRGLMLADGLAVEVLCRCNF
ncbi:MAG: radical SAM family heme chaperone HemW [Puniceicoccales bacterium]|jgi:oxygen-independent coproporphyrinogen-3 oxidase|nr:radical SAM family heme chaperone HemW [Puniceicoccales bacterium]